MTGINYFMFNDEFEQETVRVQNDNPCAPDYIDSAWLGDEYFQTLQDENEEDCNDDCDLEDNKACAKKCKETSRSFEIVSLNLALIKRYCQILRLQNELKIEVHGDLHVRSLRECVSGANAT